MKDKRNLPNQKNKSFFSSVYHAWEGFKATLETEKNMRFHVVAAVLVLVMGWVVNLSANEWLWLVLAIAFMWICELLNTAIETLTDLVVGNQRHPLAKRAKDIAAAAALVASLFALIVGMIIFIPKLLELI